MAITQARKVQIAKFWCLKSSTNIWLSCGIINSIPKINKIELEGRKDSKSAKIGQFFTLKKMFGLISPNEGHEGIISQLFSGSIVADLSNGILHLPGSQNFYFPASWQVCIRFEDFILFVMTLYDYELSVFTRSLFSKKSDIVTTSEMDLDPGAVQQSPSSLSSKLWIKCL